MYGLILQNMAEYIQNKHGDNMWKKVGNNPVKNLKPSSWCHIPKIRNHWVNQVKESLNIEQDTFGANEVFPEAQAGDHIHSKEKMDSKLKAGLIKKRGHIRIWNIDNWDLPPKARWASQQWRSWEWKTKNSTRWASIYLTCAIGTLYLWWKIPWVFLTMTLSGDGEVLCDPGQTSGLWTHHLAPWPPSQVSIFRHKNVDNHHYKKHSLFFSKWQKQLLQNFSSIFHNKCSTQRLLPEPWQSPWLLEVHIPKGKTKKKR